MFTNDGGGVEHRHRIGVIDAFRGIAIISVLLFHFLVRWAPPMSVVDLYGYLRRYPQVLALGALGVEVFFVISGLVIAMTLDGCASGREFVVKRFARLYPAFVVAATLTFILTRFAGPHEFGRTVGDYAVGLTMLAADFHHRFIDGAYWSLVVEIKFYAFSAAGFVLLRRDFWKVLIAAAILGTALEQFKPYAADAVFISLYMPLFLAGVAAWLGVFAHRRGPAAITAVVAAVLFAVHAGRLAPAYGSTAGTSTFIITVAGAMIALVALGCPYRFAPLAFVGRISYSLYLIHQNVGTTLIGGLTRLGASDLAAFAVATICCGALAWLGFVYVEEPGRRFVMRSLVPAARAQSAAALRVGL